MKFYFRIIIQIQKRNKNHSKMKILRAIRGLVQMSDFFNSSQLLRYQNQNEYRTLTGGIVSIGIAITIVIGFASMISDTLNKTAITYTQKQERKVDPTHIEFNVSPQANFMFGIEVWGYNLSQENRIFDVRLELLTSERNSNERNQTYTDIGLEICTKDHWDFIPEVGQNFQSLNVNTWLCPKVGTVIPIGGKYTSNFYQQISLTLHQCSNSTDPSRPCGTQQDFDNYFVQNPEWSFFTIYTVNAVVNPDQPQYKKYYLQDRNWIIFGREMGIQLQLYTDDITIVTDQSIWPYSQNVEDHVTIINYDPVMYPYQINADTPLAKMFILKSPASITYNRQVQKISAVFSYIGGLIGAVLAVMFIVNSYTSFSLQITIAYEIFKQNRADKIKQQMNNRVGNSSEVQDNEVMQDENHQSIKNVSIVTYAKYLLYSIIKYFKKPSFWPEMQYLQQARSEVLHQLDVKALVKRIVFMEYSLTYLFEDYQLEGMQKIRPVKPQDIKKIRQIIVQVNNIDEFSLQKKEEKQKQVKQANYKDQIKMQNSLIPPSNKPKRNSPSKINVQSINSMHSVMRQQIIGPETSNGLLIPMSKKVKIDKLMLSAKQGNIMSKKIWQGITTRKIIPFSSEKSMNNEHFQ